MRQQYARAGGVILLAVVMTGGMPDSARARAEESLTRDQAAAALRRAVTFFRRQVSAEGGYVWRYSEDTTLCEGEGRATRRTAWVQPPGTPSVGEALLSAWQRTGEPACLEAALETGRALVRGQLHSGGWDYRIEFDPAARRQYAYRVDGPPGSQRNVTTLDDNTTQAALGYLMRLDQATDFRHADIHAAATYALDKLLEAQYPNGAWPQRFSGPPDPEQFPVLPARYPESWSRTYPKQDYREYYTFNDNTIADMIATLFLAARIYREPRYQAAAEKAGGFILLAQMPDPQPAWAQQYDRQMVPAWARKFEPPAVTGGESQQVLRTLLDLYRETGNQRYLQPVPKALAYLQSSTLPDGRLARFYELRTNRPLYFTRDYQLTYADDDLPTHYGFQVGSRLESIQREYERLRKLSDDQRLAEIRPTAPTYRLTRDLESRARQAVQRLDDRGAWVDAGQLRTYSSEASQNPPDALNGRIIETRTFIANVDVLSRYLAADGN